MTSGLRPLRLPALLRGPVERRLARLLCPPAVAPLAWSRCFLEPAGEAGLAPAGGASWRIFANPVSVFVGGVAAVVLELAEPRVRAGVWNHTRFREQPLARMQGTAFATMLSTYGPASRARELIAQVNRRHAAIAGTTPAGAPYRAHDPELLAWVQATALHGFLQAFRLYVGEVTPAQADGFYAEGRVPARLYGVPAPPDGQAAVAALFDAMGPRLEPTPVLEEFLGIVARMPALPGPLRPLQHLLVKAAVQCVPAGTRARLGLDARRWRLSRSQTTLVRGLARLAGRLELATHPAALACRRLGLGPGWIPRG